MVNLCAFSAIVLLAITTVVAHPTASLSESEIARRADFQKFARRSLDNCQDVLRRRGHIERSVARRQALADELRRKRGLPTSNVYKRLNIDDILDTDHESDEDYSAGSDPFGGTGSCTLVSESTQGPYYVDGEYVRSDITEDQGGIYSYVDVELIDYSTCEPVADVYIDFWHCNATGVYSGVVAGGNGNQNDESNLDKTFLRGIQATNSEGYAQFETIFPGHYTSRANHIHVLAHGDGTVFSNGTFKTSSDRHVGQLFFDQSLITVVEKTSPYASNTQQLTENEDDSILVNTVSGTNGVDPILEYVYLGNSISDGLLLWGSMGIDLSASYSVSSAATLTEDGGVENSNSGGGNAPGGGGPGGGGPP
ncbi:aromatic compound dioxygenase [Armillaria novae-zelandiae]|uniref:Aromatic compound dioxygenase n=1 Tax=Armillaria novae-zelandiae TaxID=153914 RepID=A0AA39PNV2_9AGAR|nr:aromatic compound dioxygenase [Armillaria novae-zelandiae]